MKITKPFVWYGGKGNSTMLPKLMKFVPLGGRPYAEPYAGSASLFFARPPAPVEALNDLDGRVVNFFRVMQSDAGFKELYHRLRWTPYSRAEFARATKILTGDGYSDVDKAWAFFVAANQSVSGELKNWGVSLCSSTREMAKAISRWTQRLDLMERFRARLLRAQIDQRDALEFIEYWDNPDAVLYVDPPYHPDTRKEKNYAVEADAAHHESLVSLLLKCKGAVVLSGYRHAVHERLEESGWVRRDFKVSCCAAARVRTSDLRGAGAVLARVPRTESIWLNPRAAELLQLC